MKEMLTLQFGEFSNFVGSHYWNLQAQAFDHTGNVPESLFRSYNRRYVPRMISCGYKGSFNDVAFKQVTDTPPITTWNASVDTIQSERIQPTSYQKLLAKEESQISKGSDIHLDIDSVDADFNLSKEVSVWSDFMRTELAHKSIFELSRVPLQDGSSSNQLGTFEQGTTLLEDVYEREEILDRIRWMVEECDNLGGVQVLFDSEGFFGGIASEIVRDFKDDISHNIPILTYCLSSSPEPTRTHRFNEALSISEMASLSSLTIPMSANSVVNLPSFVTKNPNWFQTSSVIALGIDTLSQGIINPDGVHNPMSLSSLSRHLDGFSGLSIEFPHSPTSIINEISKSTNIKSLHQLSNVVSITENMTNNYHPSLQFTASRGISDKMMPEIVEEFKAVLKKGGKLPELHTLEDFYNYYFNLTSSRNAYLTYQDDMVSIPPPFPHLSFSKDSKYMSTSQNRIQRAPVLTHLQSGQNIRESLLFYSNQLNIPNSSEQVSDAKNYLQTLADNHND